jgi:Transposase DDE domain group 1
MTEGISQLTLGFHPTLPVQVKFDAPQISSDGGVLLRRQIDDRLGLSQWFAALLPDERDPAKVEHDRQEQVRQRLYQIALGYEDCNDADRLRHDPLLKSACARTRSAAGLSSQPTLSRLENAIAARTLRALLLRLEGHYMSSLPQSPEVIILDIDTTDDPAHGQQQLTFFHGYYDHHIYHPLMIFDGQSGQLVTALLRPGNTHAARGALGVLRRIIHALKRRFPDVQIVVRGDSGFAVPRLLEMLEALNRELGGVDSLLGLAQNSVLLRQGAHALTEASTRFARTGQGVQYFDSFLYAAETWSHKRRVVMKAEVTAHGLNPRFVVTSLEGFAPEVLYRG